MRKRWERFLAGIPFAVALAAGVASLAGVDPILQAFAFLYGLYLWAAFAVYLTLRDRNFHWFLEQSPWWFIAFSIGVSQWPLRVGFLVSSPALQQLADDVAAGKSLPMPQRAGLFEIRKAGVNWNGNVFLWTDPDPSGPVGFVRCRKVQDTDGFNISMAYRLSSDWQFLVED